MKIGQINKIIESYSACRPKHCCDTCPMRNIWNNHDCQHILDSYVLNALKRLKHLEFSLHTEEWSKIEPDTVFRTFIIKDVTNNSEIRLYNALRRNGIDTITQFADTDPKIIMRIRNVGRKLISIAEERHKEARELLNLEPIEFDPGDVTFILNMKPYPEEYKESHGYYD